MSTAKKDGQKTSSRKQPAGLRKTAVKARDESADRKPVRRPEEPIKTKSKQPLAANAKQKTASSTRIENNKDKVLGTRSVDALSSEPRRKVPGTPTSKRVSKTQFFPSKHMYSNALKPADNVDSSIPQSKRVSTYHLQDSKPGVQSTINKKSNNTTIETRKNPDTSPDSSTISERPRTATLRKGSIVNANIVGPEVPKFRAKSPSPKSEISDEYKYEDDFESYESDFEECSSSSTASNVNNMTGEETSSDSSERLAPRELRSAQKRVTDEEKKLDSGNFDLHEYKHKQVLDNIKESVEKENANFSKQEAQRNNNPASLSDEGFEDQKSLQFINFLDANNKDKRRRSRELRQQRGEQILSMIRLDHFSFTLFDLPPVPYEIFIKSYGNSNAIQTASQTGEDDVSEEVQTDGIPLSTRWTQAPVSFSKIDREDPNFWQVYRSECLGVGGDTVEEVKGTRVTDEDYLLKFLRSAGGLVLRLIEENSLREADHVVNNSRDLPFSEGYMSLNTDVELLRQTRVQSVSFCCDNSNKLLTVHSSVGDLLSVIAVWNSSNPLGPEHLLRSHGTVTSCSFGSGHLDYIYAGQYDGTISMWETKQTSSFSDTNLEIRIPVYSTGVGAGHLSKIVAVHSIIERSTEFFLSENSSKEICSLDEEGDLILWSVIVKSSPSTTTGTEVILVKNMTVSLKSLHPDLTALKCTDFVLSTINTNVAFISTNYGFIIHHFVKGGRASVRRFLPGPQSIANCLDTCPFSTDYFLAGYANGHINLYSTSVEKPLMIMSDKDNALHTCSIELIQWSKSKPFVIFAKDSSNTVHIWNLNESDLFPIYSVPFDMKITCMKLSPSGEDEQKKSYLLLGTEDGKIHLHVLNQDYTQSAKQTYEDDVKIFKNYVNRL